MVGGPRNEIKFAFGSGISGRSCASPNLLKISSPKPSVENPPCSGLGDFQNRDSPGLPEPQLPPYGSKNFCDFT